MSFFQNIFDTEFRANLFSADRKLQSTFKIPANPNRSDYMVSVNAPFDLSVASNLTINYARDPLLIGYVSVTVNVAGANASSTTAREVSTKLNENIDFSDVFQAIAQDNKVFITAKKDRVSFRAYIGNSGAEQSLRFNKRAPVAELPSYFERYSFDNRFNYPDAGPHRLVLLDPENSVDADVISKAGLDPDNPTPDWKLLRGSNDAFWFYKRSYTSGQLTSEIKYPAGAVEGDLAKRTFYVYDGSDLVNVMEIPYVLQSGDLMTPPEL